MNVMVKSILKRVIKGCINVIELLTGITINIKLKPRIRIKTHKNAVNNGTSMQYYVDLVEKFCNFKPKNIFEIGANYGQDAEYLRKSFDIDAKNIFVFEPHPQIFKELKKMYDFNCYDLAVSNIAGRATFHSIDIENNEYKNSGISSLRNGIKTNRKNFIDIDVEVIRMDEFIKKNKIGEIDFLKIDTEGANYEAIEGFGIELNKIKVIQTEGEYKQYWEDQKLYKDMESYLIERDFLLVDFKLSSDGIQSDSLWIQKKYMK
jgi:FkbM family methyltransferase